MDKTVMIEINGEEIEVDEHCADLVLFFNKIGLKTAMCCQGHSKPIYRVWFDVEDKKMEEFVKKTGEWTEVYPILIDKENKKYETKRVMRGLEGWVYQRHWFPMGKYEKVWVYQVEGFTNEDAIRRAYKDLETMKAIYFDKDKEKIMKKQEEKAKLLKNKLNKGEL